MPPSIFSLVGILTRSDPNCARSRQEGFVLVFIRAGSWVAQASHQFLLFSGPVPLTWLVGSSGPSRGSHHQTLILLLLLLTCTRELVNGTGRIRRLRRGQVYLNSRYVVRVGLEVVGLRVCRQDSALISGTDLICIWYFINVDDLRVWSGVCVGGQRSTTNCNHNRLQYHSGSWQYAEYVTTGATHAAIPLYSALWLWQMTNNTISTVMSWELISDAQSVSPACFLVTVVAKKFLILNFSEYFQRFSGN